MLQNVKTNKADTENMMRLLEMMHKMLKHVSVLTTELSKQGIKEKIENDISVIKRNKYILDQAQTV